MRILIVEDNRSHREFLEEGLSTISDADLASVTSEREFIELWKEIENEPPDVALIDVMLRWDYARPDPKPPDPAQNIYDAGIRCMRKMKESDRTSHVPIILYTVVSRPDLESMVKKLPKGVTYLEKTPDISAVTGLIGELTSAARSRP